ncbi:MAG: DotU family type IV/VI secretion system protein [Acidobacteriota bacterium]|nr:DotU family type IV/VI secretion system protein [Acidobacteriota bacterium]
MGATLFGATNIQPPEASSSGPRRPENLAFLFQEILTVIVRIRASRQPVTDAQKFRMDMKAALKRAEKDALTKGYLPNDIRPATFAVVAFLDESVLNSSNTAFSDWSRMPLQEEMYGNQLAGEIFFQNLERLIARPDNQDLADLLEVYVLCLLLGYKGRYGLSGQEALRPIIDSVAGKIRRIRGPLRGFSPSWALPEGPVALSGPDPWIRRLVWAAGISVLLAAILFISFRWILGSGVAGLNALAGLKLG